jgi:hypothetical protein
MIRMQGKALVATWRPFEEGGTSHMRASQIPSDNVTILDQIVIAQHKDGFWGTYPLANCSVIWQGKPVVTLVTEDDQETTLDIVGSENTLADELKSHVTIRAKTTAMSTSDSAMEGDFDTQFFGPATAQRIADAEKASHAELDEDGILR